MAQKIDTKGKGEPFLHYWSEGTCAGRANEGLRTRLGGTVETSEGTLRFQDTCVCMACLTMT